MSAAGETGLLSPSPAVGAARPLDVAVRERLVLAVLALSLPVAILLAAGIGSVGIPAASWLSILEGRPDGLGSLVLTIRLPRVAMAGLVGAGLALAGASLQAMFRNPLADPGLTGPASGAMLAAVAVIVLWHHASAGALGLLGVHTLPVAASLGCAATTVLVYRLAREADGQVSIGRLLLAGIGVNAFVAALVGVLITVSDDNQLRSIQFWMMGSLGGIGWINALAAGPVVLVAGLVLARCGRALDAFTLGEGDAFAAGVDTRRLKRVVIAAGAFCTGASVAFTGLIGFVGLIAPHIVRFLGGHRHPFVLPASALLGAILVILADVVARILVAPAELPIGIVTSLIGAPFFLALLQSRSARA